MKSQKGFTIIELTVGMTLLAYVFLLFLGGYLILTRVYRRNMAVRAAQQNGRVVMEEILREARVSYKAEVLPGDTNITVTGPSGSANYTFDELCLYQTGKAVKYGVAKAASVYVMRRQLPSPTSSCDSVDVGFVVPGSVQLNATDSRVVRFEVDVQGSGTPQQSINLNMRFGSVYNFNDPSIDINGADCRTAESSVCAITDLVSSATLRGSR